MTYEEAVRELSIEYLGDSDEMIQAKQIAIEALQKQTPRTPELERVSLDDGKYINYMLHCPQCEKNFGSCFNIDYYNELRFCPRCGQAIKWR